ncbi:RteC domain-containing protein [Pedobacter sp. SYSU D00535]|uniref:RteC domain-containing protein n=1 Tax=Pedobacter sp. SYSU D00535 TaxID=2810308 RepID=UPI001A958ED9|nr:RteC domain-containing protein [Pedobacter sp. SYSU D00535]
MKTFTERLYHAMEIELYELSIQTTSESERLKGAIKVCRKALIILKKFISSYFFENMDDEVLFFKQIKPLFYSQYIYYVSLYNFLIKKPAGGEDMLKEYIVSELADLKRFFDHNQVFYQYYRTQATYMDSIYFTRGTGDIYSELEDFQGDEMFSTTHDYKLSKIIANEKFQEYLGKLLKPAGIESHRLSEIPVVWTSNQTDLVELIYALVESGAFNNGNIEIKYLMNYFQSMFQVDLNHYYRKYTDITNRKKERTVFLDRLKAGLIRKMEEKYELKTN